MKYIVILQIYLVDLSHTSIHYDEALQVIIPGDVDILVFITQSLLMYEENYGG